MFIHVIHEDGNILVLDKPSGMVVHPFDFSDEKTILDFLQENYPDIFAIKNKFTLQDGRTINLGGIVHKLDRDTSGVLLIARNQATFDDLKNQFAKRTIEKKYVALVEGMIEKPSFRIDAPLGRGKKDYKQSTSPVNPRGPLRGAVTDVVVVERTKGRTLVELSPRTGRTHQLRAHLSSVGHPIVGDKAYGSTIENERIMLHAASLTCTVNEKQMTYSSPLPPSFP